MTVRYEFETLPGGHRFEDEHLHPQIDAYDLVKARTLPLPRVSAHQRQRQYSRRVDLTDQRVPLPSRPTHALDRISRIVESEDHPLVPSPRVLAPQQIRIPSPIQISKSSVCKAPSRPVTSPVRYKHAIENTPAPTLPSISHLIAPRITRPLPSRRLVHSAPPSPTSPVPIPAPLASLVRSYSDRVVTAVKSSCVQLLVKERQEKEAIRLELEALKRSIAHPAKRRRLVYSDADEETLVDHRRGSGSSSGSGFSDTETLVGSELDAEVRKKLGTGYRYLSSPSPRSRSSSYDYSPPSRSRSVTG